MRYVKGSRYLAAADGAAVGILAYVGPAGRPVACPVTPFVDGDDLVVSCVLGLIRKAAAIRQHPSACFAPGDDRVAVSWLDGETGPQIAPLAAVPDPDLASDLVPEGPACVLIHEEGRGGRDLRQLRISGDVAGGRLAVRRRSGSLTVSPPGLADQFRGFRALARQARANRPVLARWRAEDPPADDRSHSTRYTASWNLPGDRSRSAWMYSIRPCTIPRPPTSGVPGCTRISSPGNSPAAIVPVIVGDSHQLLRTWRSLFDAGLYVNPAIPPAVEPGSALLRASCMSSHIPAHVDEAIGIFSAAFHTALTH